MEDIRFGGDTFKVEDWEYLGAVQHDGGEYVALQLLGSADRVRFFLHAGTGYRRIEDMEVARALSRALRLQALEQFDVRAGQGWEAR